jgi:hypothetical protein
MLLRIETRPTGQFSNDPPTNTAGRLLLQLQHRFRQVSKVGPALDQTGMDELQHQARKAKHDCLLHAVVLFCATRAFFPREAFPVRGTSANL